MADAHVFFDMILPEHRAAFDAAEAQALAELQPFDVEVAMRRADGEVRWHRIAAMPRRAAGRRGAVGRPADRRHRPPRDGRRPCCEQRRRLEVAVEATGLGFWEWDVDGRRGDLVGRATGRSSAWGPTTR